MAENYCGKNCEDCPQKEIINCPGCKLGPGRQYGGDCPIAKCCRDKGHQKCDACSFHGHCGTLRGADGMPEHRIRKQQAEKERLDAIAKRAPVLGKWLWILFWLVIPSTVASLMTNETVAQWIPGLQTPGYILGAVCSAVYGLIQVSLASEESRYRKAGVCVLICGAVNLLTAWLSASFATAFWSLLLTVPAAVVSLYGEYNEITAHETVLAGVDDELAGKWFSLWKWRLIVYGIVFGSLVITGMIPLLAMIGLVVGAIGIAVVNIAKLVYLYCTANRFREYPVELLRNP